MYVPVPQWFSGILLIFIYLVANHDKTLVPNTAPLTEPPRDAEEESDVGGFSWDELLLEDEDEETMDWSE